jgi:hypothetical protein
MIDVTEPVFTHGPNTGACRAKSVVATIAWGLRSGTVVRDLRLLERVDNSRAESGLSRERKVMATPVGKRALMVEQIANLAAFPNPNPHALPPDGLRAAGHRPRALARSRCGPDRPALPSGLPGVEPGRWAHPARVPVLAPIPVRHSLMATLWTAPPRCERTTLS